MSDTANKGFETERARLLEVTNLLLRGEQEPGFLDPHQEHELRQERQHLHWGLSLHSLGLKGNPFKRYVFTDTNGRALTVQGWEMAKELVPVLGRPLGEGFVADGDGLVNDGLTEDERLDCEAMEEGMYR